MDRPPETSRVNPAAQTRPPSRFTAFSPVHRACFWRLVHSWPAAHAQAIHGRRWNAQQRRGLPMFTIRLPWPDTSVLLSAPLPGAPPLVRFGLVALLIVVPILLLLLLYSYELRLVPRLNATALL